MTSWRVAGAVVTGALVAGAVVAAGAPLRLAAPGQIVTTRLAVPVEAALKDPLHRALHRALDHAVETLDHAAHDAVDDASFGEALVEVVAPPVI